MPRNKSRSAQNYRRGEALKRRLNELNFWRGFNNGLIIHQGDVVDPKKKAAVAEIDIANIQSKLQTVHQMTPINNMSIEEYLDADLEFTKGLMTN